VLSNTGAGYQPSSASAAAAVEIISTETISETVAGRVIRLVIMAGSLFSIFLIVEYERRRPAKIFMSKQCAGHAD
jgi:hypothetical protein